MLRIINLKKSYPSKIILNNVNLEAHPGQLTIVEGKNGAGKSTLLALLSGALKPDEGVILLDDMGMNDFSDSITHFHQDPKHSCALSLTVMENLVLFLMKSHPATFRRALRKEMKDKALNHLNFLGLEYDHFLDTPMGQLSGGQRQILAFAMATINKPKLILFDEPTAALDEATSHVLMQLIKKLLTLWRIPAIMISHDHGLNQSYGDTILTLAHGKITKH